MSDQYLATRRWPAGAAVRAVDDSARSMAEVALLDCDAYVGAHPALAGANEAAELIAEMNRTGIAAAVVTHHQAMWHSAAAGNEAVLSACATTDRLRPAWVLLPSTCQELPPAKDYIAEGVERGVVAFRVCPADNVFSLIETGSDEFLEELQWRRLPLLVDADQVPHPDLIRLADGYPELPIILCRVGYRSLRRIAGLLDRAVNVHLDLANLSSQNAIGWLTQRFSVERLVFGTATPVRDPAEAVANLMLSELSDQEVAVVGRDNARRLFGEK